MGNVSRLERGTPRQRLEEFMIEGALLTAKRAVPWIHGALKTISHHGGIRAPVEVVNAYCKEDRGGLLIVHRDLELSTGDYGFRAYMD